MIEYIKLPASLVEELAEDMYSSEPGEWITSADGVDWRYVAQERQGSRRWMEDWILVIERADDTFWAIDYSVGLTENQDNEIPWCKSMWSTELPESCKAYRVWPVVKKIVEYTNREPSSS